jgi:lipid A 3-O-deacylase
MTTLRKSEKKRFLLSGQFSIFVTAVLAAVLTYGVPVSVCAETLPKNEGYGLHLNEVGVGVGYARGSLKGQTDNLSTYPVFVRFGFNANSLFGVKSREQMLQLVCEPLVSKLSGPENGVEIGCGFGIRYLYGLGRSVDFILEGSVAPIYYSIDTIEQGRAGFNFLDQIGAGFRYRLAGDKAIFGGYRWRHISHADLVHRPNRGINSNAVITGFSWLY